MAFRKRSSIARALASALVIAAGCGGGPDTNGTTGGGGPVTLEVLPQRLAAAYCARAFSCCTADERVKVFDNLDMPPQTEADCVDAFGTSYTTFSTEQKIAVDAGRLGYDEGKAAACIGKIQAACSSSGGDVLQEDADCLGMFFGKVADGGECNSTDECATGSSYCAGRTATMLGACQPPPVDGSPCPDFICQPGHVCAFDGTSSTCVTPKADGMPCAADAECVSTKCNGTTNTCAPLSPIGAACGSTSECKDGYCDSGSMVCAARKPDGSPCTIYEECQSNDCDPGTKTCGSSAPICTGM